MSIEVLLTLLLASSAYCRTFFIENHLPFTIWIGTQGNAASDTRPAYPPINDGGWEMAAGSAMSVDVQDDWGGRIWARTGCNFDENGNGHCETGDCGNKLKCAGAGGVPPATLAEITMQGDQGQDSYDISLVDGYNVQASMMPTDQSGSAPWCSTGSCTNDLNANCPAELKVDGDGGTVSCKSACEAFNTDETCCRGEYNDPQKCASNSYAQYFKQGCPDAYSYAYDDNTSLLACKNTNYKFIFGV